MPPCVALRGSDLHATLMLQRSPALGGIISYSMQSCTCSECGLNEPAALFALPNRHLRLPSFPAPSSSGHEYDAPGVFATNPREAPGTVSWREAVPVGHTDLSPAEVHAVVQQMGQQFRGNRWGDCGPSGLGTLAESRASS